MDVLVCFQHNFVMACGVMLKSLLDHCTIPLHLHAIIDPDVTEEDISKIKRVDRGYGERWFAHFYRFDDNIIRMLPQSKNKRFDRSVYFRLFAVSILPSNIDKVLYLDCDTLIVDDISPLFEIKLTGGIGAVLNQSQREEYFKRLQLPMEQGYFNSGVLLLNLKWWRLNDIETKFLRIIDENNILLKNPDQDILNIVFAQTRLLLPLRYNLQSTFF